MNRALSVALVGVMTIGLTGCEFLKFTEKVDDAVARARAERDRARGPAALASQGEWSTLLDATPAVLDFGAVRIGTESTQTISFANPTAFVVTVLNMTWTPPELSITSSATRFDVPAHSRVTVTVGFRPLEVRTVTGRLLLEIDTAGNRFIRIPIKGQAVRSP